MEASRDSSCSRVGSLRPAPMSTEISDKTRNHEFPYFQYLSLLGILTSLLGFTAIYLPASTTYFTTLPSQQSSLDKPQHALLVPITASPVLTLFWLCVGVAVCQVWFGGWMRVWWSQYPRLGFQPNGVDNLKSLISQKEKSKAFRTAILNTIISALLIHAMVIGFGAPATSYIAQTYFLSLLLSLLAIFIPSYALSLPLLLKGTDDAKLSWVIVMRLFGQRRLTTSLERTIVYPCYFVFIGSWLGAIPIALDWDRPWQAWPLTPAYGGLLGYILGLWLTLGANVFIRLAQEGSPLPPISSTKSL